MDDKAFKLQELKERKQSKPKPKKEQVPCTRLTWTGSAEGHKTLRQWVYATVRDGSLTALERRAAPIMREHFNSVTGDFWMSQESIPEETGWDESLFSKGRTRLWERGYLVKVWGKPPSAPKGYKGWMFFAALPDHMADARVSTGLTLKEGSGVTPALTQQNETCSHSAECDPPSLNLDLDLETDPESQDMATGAGDLERRDRFSKKEEGEEDSLEIITTAEFRALPADTQSTLSDDRSYAIVHMPDGSRRKYPLGTIDLRRDR